MNVDEIRNLTKENQDISRVKIAVEDIEKGIERKAMKGETKYTVIPDLIPCFMSIHSKEFELDEIKEHFTKSRFNVRLNFKWKKGFDICW